MTTQENRKPKIREAFREYTSDKAGLDFGRLTDKQRSYWLIHYYIHKIHNKLRSVISDDDFDSAYIDGPSDLGADFIHRDDGRVLILQAKYTGSSNSIDAESIEHFQSFVSRVTSGAFSQNSKLADALSDIDWENDIFDLQFVALSRIDGQALTQSQQQPSFPDHLSGFTERVTIEYLDESQLDQELRNALSLTTGIPSEATLVACRSISGRSSVIELEAGNFRSCIMVVDSSQIVNLWKQFKDSLFTLNIRNYIGRTSTNKAILVSAREDAEHFFHFNNGISCLATSLRVSDTADRVVTTGIQIINGAQTVKSLVKAAQTSHSGSPMLLVRITEVKNGYGRDRKFYDSVIRYNNTQNVIKVSDFRSNDPIQTDLREKFGRLTRYGKHVDYMSKRTDSPRPNSIPIRLEDFAKSIYSFLGDPVSFANSTSFLFDDTETGGYKVVFGDGESVWSVMPREEFEFRSAIWWLAASFGERLATERKQMKDGIERMAIERKWIVLHAARLLLEKSFGNDGYKVQLRKASDGQWKFGEESIGRWFDSIYEQSKTVVIYRYKEAQKRPDFVHRNWTRSKQTVHDLRDFIMGAPLTGLRGISES